MELPVIHIFLFTATVILGLFFGMYIGFSVLSIRDRIRVRKRRSPPKKKRSPPGKKKTKKTKEKSEKHNKKEKREKKKKNGSCCLSERAETGDSYVGFLCEESGKDVADKVNSLRKTQDKKYHV